MSSRKQMDRICHFIGSPIDAESETRTRALLASHPQNAYGTHASGLADSRIDEDEIGARFARYRAHYGVEAEGRPR